MVAETILVAGGTGLIGEPVARQLRSDGFQVRLLVRDLRRARDRLGHDFAYVQGDVEDAAVVERAVAGCTGVHVSLGSAGTPQVIDRVEHGGTARLAAAAARHGVARFSYLTGSLIHEAYGPKLPEHRAKLRAERAIQDSGVPYVFFRPTYFIDNLPRHVQGKVAVVLGRRQPPLHMVAAGDFAGMVSRAFRIPEAANRDFFVHGPEAVTIPDALGLYGKLVKPGTRVVTVPLGSCRWPTGSSWVAASGPTSSSWGSSSASASGATRPGRPGRSARPPPPSASGVSNAPTPPARGWPHGDERGAGSLRRQTTKDPEG